MGGAKGLESGVVRQGISQLVMPRTPSAFTYAVTGSGSASDARRWTEVVKAVLRRQAGGRKGLPAADAADPVAIDAHTGARL